MTAGKSVLIVEDEFLIADLITEMVTDIGMSVCGVAANADKAIGSLRNTSRMSC